MRILEDIQLTQLTDHTPEWYMTLATESGWEARLVAFSIILQASYEPGRYEAFIEKLERAKAKASAFRGFSTSWDAADFDRAVLLSLSLPEVSVSGFEDEDVCPACDRGTFPRDYGKRAGRIRTPHKVALAADRFVIVHRSVKEQAERELEGVSFAPFDREGRYFTVVPSAELRHQIVHPDDGININGNCPKCGRVQYDAFFGPLRYRRDEWNGEDVVYSYFSDELLFTRRAFDLLRSSDIEVDVSEPVVLE